MLVISTGLATFATKPATFVNIHVGGDKNSAAYPLPKSITLRIPKLWKKKIGNNNFGTIFANVPRDDIFWSSF